MLICGGVRPRIGEVEDQARTFAGQVAEERLVGPGIVGPPEHEGEVGLEQRADRPREQVHGLRAGAEHDPLAADLREARGGQVAERRDLGRDAAIRLVGAQDHDRPARITRRHGVEHAFEAGGVDQPAHDDEVGQHDPRHVRALGGGSAHPLGGRAPEPRQLGLDVVGIDGDPPTAQERVARCVGHVALSTAWGRRRASRAIRSRLDSTPSPSMIRTCSGSRTGSSPRWIVKVSFAIASCRASTIASRS